MNKQKPDEEFARIDLSYFRRQDGIEEIVPCPESHHIKHAFVRSTTLDNATSKKATPPEFTRTTPPKSASLKSPEELIEKITRILFGDVGYSYESLFGPYLAGADTVTLYEPFVRATHQLANLVRFAELLIRIGDCRSLKLIAGFPESDEQLTDVTKGLEDLKWSLKSHDIQFEYEFSPTLHDREMALSNGWFIRSGRGLDIYQKPESWFSIGVNDLNHRPCLETTVAFQRI